MLTNKKMKEIAIQKDDDLMSQDEHFRRLTHPLNQLRRAEVFVESPKAADKKRTESVKRADGTSSGLLHGARRNSC